MGCTGCMFLGKNCGGTEGPQGLPTLDPASLTKQQVLEIACTLARVGTVLCDLGQGGSSLFPRVDVDEPYVWDLEEN